MGLKHIGKNSREENLEKPNHLYRLTTNNTHKLWLSDGVKERLKHLHVSRWGNILK